jgi:hypothetical protein
MRRSHCTALAESCPAKNCPCAGGGNREAGGGHRGGEGRRGPNSRQVGFASGAGGGFAGQPWTCIGCKRWIGRSTGELHRVQAGDPLLNGRLTSRARAPLAAHLSACTGCKSPVGRRPARRLRSCPLPVSGPGWLHGRSPRYPLDRQLAAPARGRNPAYEAAAHNRRPSRDHQPREIPQLRASTEPGKTFPHRCANYSLCR